MCVMFLPGRNRDACDICMFLRTAPPGNVDRISCHGVVVRWTEFHDLALAALELQYQYQSAFYVFQL